MQRSTASLANPFLCPEFVIAVSRVRPAARVAVLTDGPSLIGFFPFERRGLGVGMPIAGELTDCQGLIHTPGVEWDVHELLRACRISVWQFDHLVDGQRPFEAHRSAVIPSPTIDLTDGFDSYFRKLRAESPRFCSGLARRTRNLEREAGQIRCDTDSPDKSALRLMMSWKSAQYRRTGRPDRFSQRWIVELLELLSADHGSGFSGMLSVLYAGDIPVAVNFNPRFDSVLAGWFMAYDPAFSRHSPGLIQLLRLAEGSAGLGVRLIDMGKGAKPYKDKMKNGEILVGEGIVTRRSPLAGLHWARITSSQWAVRAIRQHPPLFHTADWVLRRCGRVRSARLPVSPALGRPYAGLRTAARTAASNQMPRVTTTSPERRMAVPTPTTSFPLDATTRRFAPPLNRKPTPPPVPTITLPLAAR
jgi:CelD/BcsL family acetyltransferase involved in cellulose biosynthesis